MRWKKIQRETLENPPSQLDYGRDQCYYARELISEGYDRSPDNQMIWNFKKTSDKKGKPEWYYKEQAISRFALELSPLFKKEGKYAVATIPSSKSKSDEQYDSRLPDTIKELQKLRSGISYCEPIQVIKTVTPSHQGGSRRINDLTENYQWAGFEKEVPDELIVIDDVITSGAHFKAYQEILQRHCSCKVFGVFWAKNTHEIGFLAKKSCAQ